MVNENASDHRIPDEDEIDVLGICLNLWRRRWIIAFLTLLVVGISGIYAFVIAKPEYVSSALMLPTQTQTSDQLGSAAALLGKKSAGSADMELYQSLLTSRTVIRKLLDAPVKNSSDTGMGRIEPLFQILKIDTNTPVDVESAIERLSASVIVGSKESGAGGILEIKFTAETPWLAQGIGQSLLAIGQEELRAVRIERAGTVLPRLMFAVAQAKAEWDTSARKVSWYKDRNRSIFLPEQQLELARFQIEQQVQEQKYMLARKEYEAQVLEKVKAVPPMMILDGANLPARRDKPKRKMILIVGFVLGIAGSCIAVLVMDAFRTSPIRGRV